MPEKLGMKMMITKMKITINQTTMAMTMMMRGTLEGEPLGGVRECRTSSIVGVVFGNYAIPYFW